VNGNGKSAPDQVADAIAATETPPPVALRQFAVTITSSGRPAAIFLPVDATDGEIAEFCGWVLSAVLNTYRQERAAPKGILLPRPPQIVRA
jgi:hypothetical protein